MGQLHSWVPLVVVDLAVAAVLAAAVLVDLAAGALVVVAPAEVGNKLRMFSYPIS
jgi:hypothetical protein